MNAALHRGFCPAALDHPKQTESRNRQLIRVQPLGDSFVTGIQKCLNLTIKLTA